MVKYKPDLRKFTWYYEICERYCPRKNDLKISIQTLKNVKFFSVVTILIIVLYSGANSYCTSDICLNIINKYIKRNKYIFSFYSDFSVKVVDVDTSSQQVLEGHQAPILSVAYDPKEEYVVNFIVSCFKLGGWEIFDI